MKFASKRLSFGLVIVLLVAWGAMGLLLIESGNQLLQAQIIESGSIARLPKGVRLQLEVDKNVYGTEDSILISIRNDSRIPVWLAERADGCVPTWWRVEQLFDEDQWQTLTILRGDCPTADYGQSEFKAHSVRTDNWNGLQQTPNLGQVFERVATGTYRIAVPFLHGGEVVSGDWPEAKTAVTAAFTVQGPEIAS